MITKKPTQAISLSHLSENIAPKLVNASCFTLARGGQESHPDPLRKSSNVVIRS